MTTPTKSKLEEEILLALDAIETKTAELAKLEADVKRFAGEVATFQQQIEDQALAQKDQLASWRRRSPRPRSPIPEDFRVPYRRIVGRTGPTPWPPARMAPATAAYTAVTAQMMNDLINGHSLSFCLSCGRLLYLAETGSRQYPRPGK